MHVFGIVVLLGGILFQSAISQPVARVENAEKLQWSLHLERRFIPFIWMALWSIGISGVILQLLHPDFLWFNVTTRWQLLLLLKQLTFMLLVFFSYGYVRIFRLLENEIAHSERNEDAVEILLDKKNNFRKISVYLSLAAILLAAGM
jgi:uncharacterized membrane protein